MCGRNGCTLPARGVGFPGKGRLSSVGEELVCIPAADRTFSAPDLAGLGVGGTSDLDRAPALQNQWSVQWKRQDKH